MSKEAARSFISQVKSTKAKFASDTKEFYDDFIRGDKTPTPDDLKKLRKLIKEAEEDASAYHGDVAMATSGFGGPADTAIRNAKIMHDTLAKKIKK